MTYLEALYGSQYHELQTKGRNAAKGRLNGNVFLTALIILLFFDIIVSCIHFIPGFNDKLNTSFHRWLGNGSGKGMGKLLAIPLFAVIYFAIIKTTGTKSNYEKIVDNFMQYPDEQKNKATRKALIPFFILLAILLFGIFTSP